MATPGTFSNPAFEDSDITDEKVRLAYEEGHDADIPSNEGVVTSKSGHDPAVTEIDHDVEKGQPASSTATGGPDNTDDTVDASDPNTVWWNEPADQDPQNPLNWTFKKKWTNLFVVSWLTLVT